MSETILDSLDDASLHARGFSRIIAKTASGKITVDGAVFIPHHAAMDLKASLIAAADTYCRATGMSKARLATIVANDGKFFARIEAGGGFTVSTYERCMQRLSDRWPDCADWPSGIVRPHQMVAPSAAASVVVG